LIDADALPAFPLMAPRLQGELTPAGELSIAIWGVGEVGRLTLTPPAGPLVVAPNRIETADGTAGLYVAQSAPVLALRGFQPSGLHLPGRGDILVEPRGEDWLIVAGANAAETTKGLALGVADIRREADAHVRRCDLLPSADPLIRSMVAQAAHASLSSVRHYPDGAFAGLAAGLAYATPARTYYRDGYWTLQLLLRLAPDIVAEQIELLGRQVQDGGEAPSAVILSGPHADAFETRRIEQLALAAIHWRAGEWWSDHFDSPLFFVLAVADYVAATGDNALARRWWPKLAAIFERYVGLIGPRGLPLKPHNDRDWADNVMREGLVAYDLGLWVGALKGLAQLGKTIAPVVADAAAKMAQTACAAIDRALWLGDHYVDYVRFDGSAETHLTLDSLTLLRFGAVSEPRALEVLDAVRARLESRRNAGQPYGDFGMLCVYPPFDRPGELRAKSAFAYRYHNGADWPWLDGLYAAERLRRGLGGWRYPLTRWWEWSLAQGWAGAVEYFSPPFGRGSLLQGWSSLPAAVALADADRVLAGDGDEA
jgi:glycogen debranching enzyme